MDTKKISANLRDDAYLRPYRPIPFWSWNDELDPARLTEQIRWMRSVGIGGFFMHARGGLRTEYLGDEWMHCCDVCCDEAAKLDMDAYMYDENGWPSGFAGGKLLEDENNRDRYLTHTIGEFDPAALASYDLSGKALVRAKRKKAGARYLNIYEHISVSTVDVLNPAVVDKFLDLTHRAYLRRYGDDFAKKLRGFFTDEPQYFRWDTAYTPLLADDYRATYGEDLLDGLGLLFVEKEGYEKFRFRYWSRMRALFLQNFAKKLYDFCDEHGVLFTGHYVEESSLGYQMMCCAGVMPYYAYEHIPGIDWLGRDVSTELAVKQVGSAAAQTGRERILTESFGCCGWDVNPRELRRILDFQALGGVNLLCHHLLPYGEHGQRKRDYPQHYTPLNPWINHAFRDFNLRYTRLGALIGNSREVVNTCILHPVTSAYIDYKRNDPAFGVGELDDSFRRETEGLAGLHIPHHYVDEVLLAERGKADGGKLICGECAYTYLILPSLKTMCRTTLALIEKFVQGGGKLLLLGKAPALLEGEPYDFTLTSTVTLEEIEAAQPYRIDNPNLRSTLRHNPEGDFVFVVNPGEEPQSYTLTTAARSVRELHIDDATFSAPQGKTRTLRGGRSEILYLCDEQALPVPSHPRVSLSSPLKVVKATQNTLSLDTVRYALEGEDFGAPTAIVRLQALLLEKRYAGKLRLKYEFTCEELPSSVDLYAEKVRDGEVSVNGVTVQPAGTLEDEPNVLRYPIRDLVRQGQNEITVSLYYFQSEAVYYALFGEGVTESLRNCMVYDTSLEAVYLAGDFGVYPVGTRDGQTPDTVLCDGFVIAPPKKEIVDLTLDGYAMFAGDITVQTQIQCGKDGCILHLSGRWQTAEVEIGGQTRRLLFDDEIDVSDLVHEGKNAVTVTYTTSLRNLMGPHHFAPADEPVPVSPEFFDLIGHWTHGQSPLFRPSYSLLRNRLGD